MHRTDPRYVRTVDAALGAAYFVVLATGCAVWTYAIGTLLGFGP